MDIHDKIKFLRKQKDISVDDIVSKLNISRASYYRYESKEIYNLPIDIIAPLAQILGVAPAYLMGWTDNAQATPVRLDITAAETRHLEKYRQLDADNRIHIDRETDFLLSEQAAAANKKDGQSSA